MTLDGKPLADGSITFIPAGKGISAGGKIVDSHYELSSKDGLVPGTYQVRINASESTGRTIVDPAGNMEKPRFFNPKPACDTSIDGARTVRHTGVAKSPTVASGDEVCSNYFLDRSE